MDWHCLCNWDLQAFFSTQMDQNQTCFESETFAPITLCSALVLLEVLLDLHGCPGGESLQTQSLKGKEHDLYEDCRALED